MPACWEFTPSVLCCVLHTENTSVHWAIGLRNLQINGPVMGLCGMPYDHARNAACMRALELGADYLFFLDSDVVPPPDCVPRLVARGKDICSGLYCRRSPPVGVPVMMKPVGQWVTTLPNPNQDPLIEVDVVGAGCLLLSRNILEKLPPQRPGKHWFDWRVDLKGIDQLPLSEDFTFCMWAKQHGFPTFVDTSIRCKHIGSAEATYGQLQPLGM